MVLTSVCIYVVFPYPNNCKLDEFMKILDKYVDLPKTVFLGSIGLLFLSLSTNVGTHNSQDQVGLYRFVM